MHRPSINKLARRIISSAERRVKVSNRIDLGLEFHSVFIIWALEGRFPSLYNTNSQEDLEEERRLLYVAATRAKQNLFISYPTRVFDKTLRMVLSQPSQFIDGMSSRMLEPVALVPEGSYWNWES